MNLPVSSVEKSPVVVHRRHGRREDPIKIQSGGLIKAVAECDEANIHQLLASPIDEPTKDSSIETQEIAAAEALISLGDGEVRGVQCSIGTQCVKETRDFGCQVSSGDFLSTVADMIASERNLYTMTGLNSFLQLASILSLFSELQPENTRYSLNNKCKVILTLMKMKLNLSFAVLAILFGCTATTCKNIFAGTAMVLADCLRPALEWPSKDEVLKRMPKCFDKFRRVRVVLDCTEVRMSKFRCLRCRISSYSHYKCNHTVKFMIGVTPAGVISFLSEAYGGRASDKKIFEESGLVNMLLPYIDEVMVDKGFLIKSICEAHGINVIHPPFLRKAKQFSKADALATSDIAKARVHVERVIDRVKRFKILSDTVPTTLLPYIDQIMLIACSLTNLSSPVLADDKFL
ncbi:uncharacterized protein LOC124172074 [Ischnura elegans]|uniref:uncharacterized protein LOC124172074 n=1 Tax=Ischnura elegans TaxID=197161 RepID=UPI001ED8976A|nr:uncharacterized protein LOC124172074 [Ischnura elegans]